MNPNNYPQWVRSRLWYIRQNTTDVQTTDYRLIDKQFDQWLKDQWGLTVSCYGANIQLNFDTPQQETMFRLRWS